MTAKRPAMGRGLGALLGESPWDSNDARPQTSGESGNGSEDGVIGAIAAIPVDLVETNPFQPRKQFNDESLSELCQSIKTNGIITPLTVRKVGKKYQLISGERRLRAAKMAGLKEIPAYIRMAGDNESLEMALVENIQREDLNVMDVALSYQALMDACHLTQEQMSRRVGKGRSTVANFLRLLKLPADIQLYLKDNRISMGHARALVSVESEELQLKLAAAVVEKELSVRELEDLIRRGPETTSDTPKRRKKESANLPEWCLEGCERLAGKLQASVTVKPGRKGKGSVVITYASEDSLQKILNTLNEE